MRQALVKLLLKRDDYCLHCGDTETLVPHHRINRGMGGSKTLDDPRNIVLICSWYNGQLESDAETARRGREYGHKLSRFDSFEKPLYDQVAGQWITLTREGKKHEQTDRGVLGSSTI